MAFSLTASIKIFYRTFKLGINEGINGGRALIYGDTVDGDTGYGY